MSKREVPIPLAGARGVGAIGAILVGAAEARPAKAARTAHLRPQAG